MIHPFLRIRRLSMIPPSYNIPFLPCLALPCTTIALPYLALPFLTLSCLALSCFSFLILCNPPPCLALPILTSPYLPYLALLFLFCALPCLTLSCSFFDTRLMLVEVIETNGFQMSSSSSSSMVRS